MLMSIFAKEVVAWEASPHPGSDAYMHVSKRTIEHFDIGDYDIQVVLCLTYIEHSFFLLFISFRIPIMVAKKTEFSSLISEGLGPHQSALD